ncbi:unnamed protein product [Dicrocoelium dendriticum]|nr:unnamed protein product [Dicrocoelium dendriticum]
MRSQCFPNSTQFVHDSTFSTRVKPFVAVHQSVRTLASAHQHSNTKIPGPAFLLKDNRSRQRRLGCSAARPSSLTTAARCHHIQSVEPYFLNNRECAPAQCDMSTFSSIPKKRRVSTKGLHQRQPKKLGSRDTATLRIRGDADSNQRPSLQTKITQKMRVPQRYVLSSNHTNNNTQTSQTRFAAELRVRLSKLALEHEASGPTGTPQEKLDNTMESNISQSNVYSSRPSVLGSQLQKRGTCHDLGAPESFPSDQSPPIVKPSFLTVHEKPICHASVNQVCAKVSEIVNSTASLSGDVWQEGAASDEVPGRHNSGPAIEKVAAGADKLTSSFCESMGAKNHRKFPTATELPITEGGDELDRLEDDKPMVDEAELEASDSESTYTGRQVEVLNAVYPVIGSLFPNVPSVLRFVGEGQTVFKLPKLLRTRLKWRLSAITPNVVKRTLKRSHFRLTLRSPDWLGYFGNHLKPMGFRPIKEYQKVNHFPGSFLLGRKDKLWNNLSRLRTLFGRREVDFVPRTFSLPSDFRLLKEVWGRQSPPVRDSLSCVIGSPTRPCWIIKPPAAARGIGVRVIRHWSEIPKQRQMIVQSYISRPYLINDTKFDLRLYVYVTSFNPLRAYLHRNGLVRFASQRYSSAVADMHNRYIHLTNYSINKHTKQTQPGFENHKWKLESLWAYLLQRGVNVDGLWLLLRDIVFKTLASVTNSIAIMVDQNCRRRACVHELFGFDVLLDENLKPWLLEVNVSPSLHTNSNLDNEVKTEVVTDMFNVAGFRLPPEYRCVNFQIPSLDEVTSTSTSLSTNDITGDSTFGLFGTRSKAVSRIPSSTLPFNRTQTPPNRPLGDSKPIRGAACPKYPLVKFQAADADKLKHLNQTNNFGINPFYPLSDPRLWDLTLSWDERQKHLFHSRLMSSEEGLRCLSRQTGVCFSKEHSAKLCRTSRSMPRPTAVRKHSVHRPPLQSSSLALPDKLGSLVSHLTPDDLRTLTEFVDERYRAAMGNFEPIFPIPGVQGLRLLLFLESCGSDVYPGQLGSRTPALRYYDLLQYAFLTVHGVEQAESATYVRIVPLDVSTAIQLPDYQMLGTGKLSDAGLTVASRMTGITRKGLLRLTEACRSGLHIAATENKTQIHPWSHPTHLVNGHYAPNTGPKFTRSPTNLIQPESKPQVTRISRASASHDTCESILGGAVCFRAQSAATIRTEQTKCGTSSNGYSHTPIYSDDSVRLQYRRSTPCSTRPSKGSKTSSSVKEEGNSVRTSLMHLRAERKNHETCSARRYTFKYSDSPHSFDWVQQTKPTYFQRKASAPVRHQFDSERPLKESPWGCKSGDWKVGVDMCRNVLSATVTPRIASKLISPGATLISPTCIPTR